MLDYNFIMKESYTQAPHYFPIIASHIETTSLADETYELIQEPDEDISEAQVNVTEVNEDLNVNPKSESELHEVQSMLRN